MKKQKLIDLNTPPSSYKDKPTATMIWTNLSKLINHSFQGVENRFKISLVQGLMQNVEDYAEESEAVKRANYIFRLYKGHEKRSLHMGVVHDIEVAFKLPPAALVTPHVDKEVAYLFVYCMPRHTSAIYNWLIDQPSSVVDEVAILSGEKDIYLRLYGTRPQLKDFISNVLNGDDAPAVIQRTDTHFSFTGDVWQKYPISEHHKREPSAPHWLKDDWQAPSAA